MLGYAILAFFANDTNLFLLKYRPTRLICELNHNFLQYLRLFQTKKQYLHLKLNNYKNKITCYLLEISTTMTKFDYIHNEERNLNQQAFRANLADSTFT